NFKDGSQRARRDTALRDQLGLNTVPGIDAIIRRPVETALPQIIRALDLPGFEVGEIRITMSVTRNGGFGKPHRDDVNSGAMISFLYYFHSEPKQFSGGDLILYDRQEDLDAAELSAATRLVHSDNLLVAFPCYAVHEITRVRSQSPEFCNGRFAIAGFVFRA
ncbi:MAG: 2OG-Fe(II) oxygenase, partial [Pseudomonadota bacterium]